MAVLQITTQRKINEAVKTLSELCDKYNANYSGQDKVPAKDCLQNNEIPTLVSAASDQLAGLGIARLERIRDALPLAGITPGTAVYGDPSRKGKMLATVDSLRCGYKIMQTYAAVLELQNKLLELRALKALDEIL